MLFEYHIVIKTVNSHCEKQYKGICEICKQFEQSYVHGT